MTAQVLMYAALVWLVSGLPFVLVVMAAGRLNRREDAERASTESRWLGMEDLH